MKQTKLASWQQLKSDARKVNATTPPTEKSVVLIEPILAKPEVQETPVLPVAEEVVKPRGFAKKKIEE